MAGADAVEIKAIVPEEQIGAALERYRLETGPAPRYVTFYDTPGLDLYKAGVIARSRRIVGDEHDSTVKFRPVEPEAVPKLWRKYRGFKIEADATETGVVKSASLTMPVEKGLIKSVAAAKATIPDLFCDEQRKFLLALSKQDFDYGAVVPLGPVQAWRWRFDDPGLPWRITAELWLRDDDQRLFEVSIKVPVPQSAAAMAGFMAFLAEVGAQRADGEQAKTRWAVEHYAKGATAAVGTAT